MLKVKALTFNPAQENTYILFNEQNKAIIIDPGCYFSAEHETLNSFLKDTQLEPARLLNTHCHLDHVCGNLWVYQNWGTELWIPSGEEEVLANAPLWGEKWGMSFKNYDGPVHFIHEGDTIVLDNDTLKVILAPGHSPASMCFYAEKEKFLIGGDVLFYQSIGRTDLPGGDHETLLRSIREQLFVLPDDVVVYPGHGRPTTIGYEKRNNPFL
ncbi:MBL fold metallo-hydrolase [Sediminibacterium roseum]|uniref:MBL fold metallo-hydrolase n=1 Tax=Sediminibacterium roseum TaxID=1978412 RepID=A0ABW9ZNM7_9BACT|nr:MBL fold metallo-hydrolase [Sediminibacterium roseum]NCI48689.1 MBL fold metallo-hydrolase [Sediminibacterium roseum]